MATANSFMTSITVDGSDVTCAVLHNIQDNNTNQYFNSSWWSSNFVSGWLALTNAEFNALATNAADAAKHYTRNGHYYKVFSDSGRGSLYIQLFDQYDTLLFGYGSSGFPSGNLYICGCVFVINGDEKVSPALFVRVNGDSGGWVYAGGGSTSDADSDKIKQWIAASTPPTYTWTCWPQLSGNDGMFLMNLSTIDDSIIGDGTTAYETFDGTLFDIEPLTELYKFVYNLQNGQETKIVYCGDNYITATRRTTYVNDVTTVYVTLKFYFRSDVRIYTSPEYIVYSSASGISRDYLCLMTDEDQEVAAPNIIQYWSETGKYGINEYALPAFEEMTALYIWLQDNGQEREHVSPYDTGTTDNGGDPGTPTPQDHITDSPLPTLGGLDLGVVTLYLPTAEQMASIAAFLWSDNVLDNFKKYFNNFADNLLSLYVLPFTPSGLNTKTFKVGNMVSEITGVKFCTTRYIDRDMGTFNLEKLWDSYLDFSPYTRVELYLPYLGLHSLDTDELMCPARMDGTLQRGLGSVLSLTYRLDLLTGVIVAKVKVNGEIRYQYEGKVGLTIPLTGQTYAQMAQAIVQAGAGLATTIASGGLTAPLTAAAAVTGTVNASKPNVERIGNISGDASMLATNVPYLIVTRPNKPLLDEQEIYTGFPSYRSGTLGNFSGFTQVIEAHVEGISCTEEERALILKWLKEGIII